ncbi:MAG: hypothetical protein HY011_28115 [Acidobacteria bacterium]|nr:hypothetical protein [Acidobacteriota bacterium]
MYLLKFSIIGGFLALALCFGVTGRKVKANQSGPPAQRTGAPGEQTCALSGCHTSFALNSGSGVLTLTGLPSGGYTEGQQISLTVTLSQPNRQLYGFEITALDSQGRRAGTLTVTDNNRTLLQTSVVNGNLRQYISHNFGGSGPNGTNQGSWNFRWTAPATSTGAVTFYFAGNAANGNGSEDGDFIYTRSAVVQPGASGPQACATISAASFAQGAFAPETIVALFPTAMANLTGGASASATTIPLPTELAGVMVKIRDAAGTERNAPLFFAADGQINFMVPLGSVNGAATVTVMRGTTAVGAGTFNIETVSPGLFTANANGQGAPAALIFRQTASGQQSQVAAAVFSQATNRFEPVQIDLGPEGDVVLLIGFGTGFRNRTSLSNVSCTIGGTNATVDFASAQGGLAGLDQTNIFIPRSLIGRGLVDLVFRVDGKTANTVQLNIK